MSYLRYFSIGISALLLISCSSTKNKPVNSTPVETNTEKMIAEGFTAGTMVLSDEPGDCPVTIKLDGTDTLTYYDPIDLDDAFKTEGMKVWFKFRGLRMANRCQKANPIAIEEIKKRGE